MTNYEVVGNEITSLKHIPNVQPRMMPHEYVLRLDLNCSLTFRFDAVEKLLSTHPGFLEALKKRGIQGMSVSALSFSLSRR